MPSPKETTALHLLALQAMFIPSSLGNAMSNASLHVWPHVPHDPGIVQGPHVWLEVSQTSEEAQSASLLHSTHCSDTVSQLGVGAAQFALLVHPTHWCVALHAGKELS
jgi:hypothetical protein